MTGDTTTGRVFEQMILPALAKGGYKVEKQINIGCRIGGGRHFIDLIAKKDRRLLLISLKWQQVGGTAEQKVPFEVICLTDAVQKSAGKYKGAYLILGGEGWSLRDFYVSGELDQYLKNGGIVKILTLESFIAKANGGEL